jgi:hypothetical protein
MKRGSSPATAAFTPGKPTTPWIAVAAFYQNGCTPVSNKKDGAT